MRKDQQPSVATSHRRILPLTEKSRTIRYIAPAGTDDTPRTHRPRCSIPGNVWHVCQVQTPHFVRESCKVIWNRTSHYSQTRPARKALLLDHLRKATIMGSRGSAFA